MSFSFWFSLAVLGASIAIVAEAWRGFRRLEKLSEAAPAASPLPRLSIIVPALDEAPTIEPALRSILALDYAPLQVVAIDDRSTDATGAILDRLAIEFPGLEVVHVRELPRGWLGKNHALQLGAARARGEYLLFTDADVHFDPSALRRAIGYCEARDLAHLAVLPDVPTRTRFITANILAGIVGLMLLFRPWRARRSGRHGFGVGAFNLVRAAAYREAGGHGAIAMEVLDDIELGRLMGGRSRQDALLSGGMVSVEIYRTAAEMFRGIQKNAFTLLDYSMARLVAATLATFALSVWPWIGVVATEGMPRALNAATIAATLLLHADAARRFGYPLASLAYLPLNGALTIVLFWQVALRTRISGGVTWRGTFYPLAELRARRRR